MPALLTGRRRRLPLLCRSWLFPRSRVVAFLPRRLDLDDDRHSGPQPVSRARGVIDENLDGDALYDLGEVACRVVGGEQGELRAARRGNLFYMAFQHEPGKRVDGDSRGVAFADVGELRLLIVRLRPHVVL